MVKTVVETRETTLNDVSNKGIYGFVGSNGELYLLGRDTDGKYIFNSLAKTGKPVNAYDTIKGALKAKMDEGKEVLEFDSVEDLADFILD